MELYQLFLFTRFDDSEYEDKSESVSVAKAVGKSTGDETDDEEKLYEEDDEDVPAIGKMSDQSSGLCGITSIVGGHVGQTHNPLRDNISSNLVGFTSFLALNYDPGLGPFCEYIKFFCMHSYIRNRINQFVCFICCWIQICVYEFVYHECNMY
jgi:hypothetical protein